MEKETDKIDNKILERLLPRWMIELHDFIERERSILEKDKTQKKYIQGNRRES